MGFNSVYRSLMDVFPQVDARILKAVAIEHSKDPDAAVEIVLSEVLPYLPKQSRTFSSRPDNQNPGGLSEGEDNKQSELVRRKRVVLENSAGCSSEPQSIISENVCNAVPIGAAQHAELNLHGAQNASTVSNFYDSDHGSGNIHLHTESQELKFLVDGEAHNAKTGTAEVSNFTSKTLMHEQGAHGQACAAGNVPEESAPSFGKCKFVAEQTSHDMSTTLTNETDGANGILTNFPSSLEDFDGPCADDFYATNRKKTVVESPSDSSLLKVENSVVQPPLLSVQEQTKDGPKCDCSSEFASGPLIADSGIPEACSFSNPQTKQGSFLTVMGDVVDNSTLNSIVTRSGQICRVDLLEDIIEEAKNNKKTLFSAMESVMNMMREVERQEKDVEEAKEEAMKGGLDILNRVEELRQMLAHAKEANDMHAGGVYGEKAILATEVKELQSRLLSLSEERDRSLGILDEMRETLEARIAAAEDARKAAELEKLEKEASAQKALAELEAVMEKVVQESTILQQEAEENSKLREFLIDRGRAVDSLQGEISVICLDVKLLKEKFDERVPLSKSISSSQTSCILASSGSSLKSFASDLVAEQGEISESPDKSSSTPSVDGQSPRSTLKETRIAADRKELMDDGWDIFDKETELCS